MKKQCLFSRLAVIIIAASFLGMAGVAKERACSDPVRIIINTRPNNPSGMPRTPVDNPFYAQFENNSILLCCSASCGDVSVELVSTAGDSYQCVFDTDDGMIQIPVSGYTGHYTLTLYPSGDYYYVGEFDL